MSLRIYQYIAVGIVIGAPLMAELASNAVPAAQHAAASPGDDEEAAQPAEAEASPSNDLPRPLPAPRRVVAAGPDMTRFTGAQPLVGTAPTLDVGGIAPEAPAGDSGATPPPIAKPAAPPADAVVPPPPSVPRSKRY